MEKIIIEVQYFHGCPNADEMIANVKSAMTWLSGETEYNETLVDTAKKAQETGFRGSPTLLINGNDFENMPKNIFPALTCRFYSKGVPSASDIKKKLESLLK